ncbi:hypothetical protein BDZ45DRAFT_692946 [Acephala macrosclerotiorum]|nr:hypothetical protein BDZ45DRAFT_692946 [Acephala macrosclerotiorum]
MNATNGTNGSPKAPVKPKRASRLKDFLALGKEIFSEKEVGDYDQLLDTKKELEQQLLLKNQELNAKVEELVALRSAKTQEINSLRSSTAEKISALETENKTLFKAFEKRYKSWDTGMTTQKDLENRVAQLQLELKQANQRAESSEASNENLQHQLSNHQNSLEETKNNLRTTKRELNSKDRELKGTFRDLESAQAELETLRSELGLEYPNHEDLATKFRDLAVECHSIAKRFFRTPLPQDLILIDIWKELESSGFIRAAPKKITLSNSIAAQCLRMATAEKIIADKLCVHIFKEYYLPESSPSRAVINDVLTRLDESNPCKEAIFRLQLLAAYESDEQETIVSLVEITTKEVVKLLDPLLFAPAAREGFQSALRKLLTEAVQLWRSVQRSASKGRVLNDPENRGFNGIEEQDWDLNEEYDQAVELTRDQIVHPDERDPVISLFPQLSVGGSVICKGCALWSDQNAVVAANIEFGQLNSRHSAAGRGVRDSDKQRLSFSGSSSLGRRVEDPLMSPRSQSGNQSFSDHANSRTNSWKMPLPGAQPGERGGSADGG